MGTTLLIGSAEEGARVIAKDRQTFMFLLSADAKKAIVDQLHALAETDRPGHEYLETSGDVQVLAAVDEYGPQIFESR